MFSRHKGWFLYCMNQYLMLEINVKELSFPQPVGDHFDIWY